MNVQCSGGSRNFAKETRALKMRSAVASHLKLTTTIEKIFEADSLTTTGEVAEEVNIDHFMVVWHLKQMGKVKKLDKWVPHELTANQIVLKCCLLLFSTISVNHFLVRL